MEPLHRLILETLQMNKQALVFTPSRASAEKTAEELAKFSGAMLPELESNILKAASTPTQQCRRLAQCIRKGIAFHHAGLLSQQKEIIEDNFRSGKVKIICSTPTLAAGLSLPAFRVIITSLKRFSTEGMDWIPVLEYLQMAGRAGRPEYESFGEAIVLAKSQAEEEKIYEKYLCGEPESMYSKLAVEPVLRTYVLSLIASGRVQEKEGLFDFFSKTFWAHQFQDMQELQRKIEQMLLLLEAWKFLETDDAARQEFVAANALGKKTLRATALGKRVSELYLDPFTARHLVDCLSRFDGEKNYFSLLQTICHTLEMRPLLRCKKKDEEKVQEKLNLVSSLLLEEEPSPFDWEYGEFMNALKTALFFEAWIQEYDEEYLMERYDIRPGEIRVKQETADWLLYAADELAQILSYREVRKEVAKLRLRVQYGAKEELLPLLKLKGIGRVRARKLFARGLRDLGAMKKVDGTSLAQILGSKAVAEEVKKQVGEEIAVVPESRRKGQLSMEKFV